MLATSGAWLGCSPAPPSPPGPDAAVTDAPVELDGVCKTVAGAPPEVIVGQGQNDFLPLAELETVDVEAGPQGGHHIWIALRMRNLLKSGSRTVLAAVSPPTGTEVMPFEVIFTYDAGEGGYCVLSGLRFQLDAGGVDYVPLLGQELDVTATVTDRSGDTGQGQRRVMLSTSVL